MSKKRPADRARSDAGPTGVVMGRFGAPHGVNGDIRLKSHTSDPTAILDYTPLDGSDGRPYRLTAVRPAAGSAADMLVVRVKGIDDRNAAEAINGIDLSVSRGRLPDPELDDFYHADLIGLAAETVDGTAVGTVTAIHNHGAGDLLEVEQDTGPPVLVPFTRTVVPVVNIDSGRVVIDPPPGLLDTEGHEGAEH